MGSVVRLSTAATRTFAGSGSPRKSLDGTRISRESVEELREELREDGCRWQVARGVRSQGPVASRRRLIVTARNKMGAGETRTVRIGLALRNIQTRALSRGDREDNIACWCTTHGARCRESGRTPRPRSQSQAGCLCVMFRSSWFGRSSGSSGTTLLDAHGPRMRFSAYIDGRPEEMELWDLFVAQLKDEGDGGSQPRHWAFPSDPGRGPLTGGRAAWSSDKANFLDPNDEKVGLNDQQIEAAEASFRGTPRLPKASTTTRRSATERSGPGRSSAFTYCTLRAAATRQISPSLGSRGISASPAPRARTRPLSTW